MSHMVLKYRMPELKNSYYLSAMDAIAERYPKKKYNLIFLLVKQKISCRQSRLDTMAK
jgi:hypothetical protein